MPELPEVETVRRCLERRLIGRSIRSVEVRLPKIVRSPLKDFSDALCGASFCRIGRRGKYLLFFLDNGCTLVSHLRMEGKYMFQPEASDDTVHTRIVFHLDQDEKMLYDDSRTFGTMEIVRSSKLCDLPCLAKLGPEPCDCSPEQLRAGLCKRNTDIKTALLDQTLISGLGNIYTDELLYACKINPFRKASSVTLEECTSLTEQMNRILNEAIHEGGSTVSSYHPEAGVDGKFQLHLSAYGKKGSPCPICASTMRKDFVHGRGTTYCPRCQKVCLRVGIYGKIASGKSTVLSYFRKKGYPTFSCDEEIRDLYAHSLELKKELIRLFGEAVINDDGRISKAFIKSAVAKNPPLRKQLEGILHPMVKTAMAQFCRRHKEEEFCFLEIPLLYESHCETYVDAVIGVDAPADVQYGNLRRRGSHTPALDLKLNASSKFDKNSAKCDYIIHNDGSLQQLCDQCEAVLEKLKRL